MSEMIGRNTDKSNETDDGHQKQNQAGSRMLNTFLIRRGMMTL